MKHIPVNEFRLFGFLQEVNRQFFHPLGLALEISIDNEDNETISGIWDCREETEGIIYDKIDDEKTQRVTELQKLKATVRHEKLGFVIQPPSDSV